MLLRPLLECFLFFVMFFLYLIDSWKMSDSRVGMCCYIIDIVFIVLFSFFFLSALTIIIVLEDSSGCFFSSDMSTTSN